MKKTTAGNTRRQQQNNEQEIAFHFQFKSIAEETAEINAILKIRRLPVTGVF